MAIIKRNLGKLILFGIIFIELNIIDAQLTGVAIAMGSSELNPILGATYGCNIVFKATVSLAIAFILLWCKSGRLLKHLNFGMLGVVGWNVFAVWSWI